MRSGRGPRAMLLALLAAAAACEIQEVTLAAPEDTVVVEAVLWAGRTRQAIFLHRALGGGDTAVPDAVVEVVAPDGSAIPFAPTATGGICTLPGEVGGTCYVTDADADVAVEAGGTYSLRVELADGGRITGTTTVPGPFEMRSPARTDAVGRCAVRPLTPLELVWTRSPGAWVYVVEAEFGPSLQGAFPELELPAPFRTVGLSIGNADTTLVFPGEVGVFDRFDEDATEVLAALQAGLPDGTDAVLAIAATDRNYVNWVRGGAFNPSGTVRVASVQGDGTGVFGSLVVETFQVLAGAPSLPACAPDAGSAS